MGAGTCTQRAQPTNSQPQTPTPTPNCNSQLSTQPQTPTPNRQGVYGLVANLGSLVVRTLFAPLEELAFAVFSR